MKFKISLTFLLFCAVLTCYGQFSHSLTEDKLPWSSSPKVTGDEYTFIVFADRTGGEHQGVFQKGIELANRLNPDFSMSVGDLIDGYTLDLNFSNEQWKSFNNDLARLRSPFFYVAGNHDVSNSSMLEDWNKRYGRDYYYFNVGTDLFVVLNTQLGTGSGMSDGQPEYLANAINKHKGGHIFIFMHDPLWYPAPKLGYEKLEAALKGRPHTVFSGHYHGYLMSEIDNNKHFILATTGGGMEMRGPAMGEFYHLMQVTVKNGKPTIKNILLDGTEIPLDVVVPSSKAVISALNNFTTVTVAPIVADKAKESSMKSIITIKNPMDQLLVVGITEPSINGVTVKLDDAGQKNLIIAPNAEVAVPITVSQSLGSIDLIPPVSIPIKRSYNIREEEVVVSNDLPLTVDYKRRCLPSSAVKILATNPPFIQEDWDWKGNNDGHFTIDVSRDSKNITIKIITTDERLISIPDKPQLAQDKLFVTIAPIDAIKYGHYMLLPGNPFSVVGNKSLGIEYAMDSSVITKGNSIEATLTIPLTDLLKKGIKLNVGFMDLDLTTNNKPSVLWWRPLINSSGDYQGAGEILFR